MSSIGRGLLYNYHLENLILKGNNIDMEGLSDMCEAFKDNKKLKLKVLDLS